MKRNMLFLVLALLLALSCAAAAAEETPEVKIYGTIGLTGVDFTPYLSELPEGPTLEGTEVTIPDSGYANVYVSGCDAISTAALDGKWVIQCADYISDVSQWCTVSAERPTEEGYAIEYCWYLDDGTLSSIKVLNFEDPLSIGYEWISCFLKPSGEIDIYYAAATLLSPDAPITINYNKDGELMGYSYSVFDPSTESSVFVSFDETGSLRLIDGDDYDPEKYPSLEIITE